MKEKDWKALLKRMKLEHLKATAPGFFEQSGGYGYRINPYTDKNANALTRCIEEFINHHPSGMGQATRVNSTGTPRKMPDGSIKWSKSNTRKGIADIIGSYNGRFLSIEVKIGRDRQSEAQIKEQERITKSGGLYFVAKDFPSFLHWWKDQGFEIPHYEPINKAA